MTKRIKRQNTRGHKIQNVILCLLAICTLNIIYGDNARGQSKKHSKTANNIEKQDSAKKSSKLKPTIPSADRYQKGRVFLEYADKLSMNEFISPDYQVLNGNVKFRKGDMYMFCDSAHFYDKKNSLYAFGNVRMEQGDTLFVYSDQLYYDGNEELAKLRNNVRMENRNVTLFTDSLDYDLVANIGYYFEGGKIVDEKNELASIYGQYAPDTKDTEFLFDVIMTNDKFKLVTDTLYYNTTTKIADIVGYTTMVSDSSIIYSDKGWYDTNTDRATLYNRSLIITKDNQKLTGDTIFYNRAEGIGEVFGNMILTDSVKSTSILSDYGYYNEKNDSTFATKRALVMEYSQKDTLYLHGDTIKSFLIDNDSTRIMTAYPNVRFFRIDIQGVCDSLAFTSRDSMLYMHRHPILWNEKRQVSGNIIKVHFNDSTADKAYLPEYGMLAEHIDENFYNQLYGKEMIAYFNGKEMTRLDVNGNVQAILLPMENDSTYNKIVSAEGSFLTIDLKEQKMEKLRLWPDVTGKVIPIYLSKKADLFLKSFAWYEEIRPKDRYDIFETSNKMKELLSSPETIAPVRRIREDQ